MRIVTWNVNSVRARLPRLLPWLERERPEVVCLQETKCRDEEFPRAEVEALGYQALVHGQRAYNGVAILTRLPAEDAVYGLPGDGDDGEEERRVVGATVAGCSVLCVYVVNGQSVGSEHYARKLAWMGRLRDFVRERFPLCVGGGAGAGGDERVVVCGDFNVTFDDRDVWDPAGWRERILCSTPERRALRALLDCGLHDALRKFTDAGGIYTWWDYRTRAIERDRGLRIDHFLMSRAALDACTGVRVERELRLGEKPSDHAPVTATLAP